MSIAFGLSDTGFEPKTLMDIKAELEAEFKTHLGDVDVSAASVIGQIIGVISKVLADIWETAEDVYLSQYPDSAAGVPLDNAVALTGITRRAATKSTALLALKGTEGATIAAGTRVSVDGLGDIFETIAATTISQVAITRGIVGIDTVADNTVYTVTVDSVDYTANSGSGATADSISADLAYNMSAVPGVTVTDLGGALLIEGASFGFGVDSSMSWWTPTEVQAINTGRVIAPDGTLTVIETPASGLDAVTNFQAADIGREIETDAELRLRRMQSLSRIGASTVDAIRMRMLEELPEVDFCVVIENATESVDSEGRPPHSIEVITSGGNDADIALQIWNTKPAGISTFGTDSEVIKDSQNNDHTIYFSHPFIRRAWVRVVLTNYSEEDFPDGGAALVATNIKEYADNNISIGKDLIIQRLYSPIYSVPGIESADVYTAVIDFDTTVNDEEDATLAALFTHTLLPSKGIALKIADRFRVLGTGDTTDNALQTAKGVALVADDVFIISALTAPAVIYVGNLTHTPWAAFGQANIAVRAAEIAEFDISRINVSIA